MNALIEGFLCAIGRHEWKFSYRTTRYGGASGLQCTRCNRWHKNAIKWKYRTPRIVE